MRLDKTSVIEFSSLTELQVQLTRLLNRLFFQPSPNQGFRLGTNLHIPFHFDTTSTSLHYSLSADGSERARDNGSSLRAVTDWNAYSTHFAVSLAGWDSSITRTKACFWHASPAENAMCRSNSHRYLLAELSGCICACSIQDLAPHQGGSPLENNPTQIVRDSCWGLRYSHQLDWGLVGLTRRDCMPVLGQFWLHSPAEIAYYLWSTFLQFEDTYDI